jgi:arylsulfatase A-like enzyme/Tfp pilus assembly protein PilF
MLGIGALWWWARPARRSNEPFHPNVLLITLDTTRSDHLGAYGDASARTPNLDRLASEGVTFERAVSSAPITLPAHVSLLTGRQPFAHGVRNNGNFRVEDDLATIATILHAGGYRTAAFVSAFVLDRRSGLSRGFDEYDDRLDGSRSPDGDVERRGDRTAELALKWVADQRGRGAGAPPFFVWIHLYDPHDPYTPPPPFDAEFRDRPYDGEIAFDDAVVGSIIDRLSRLGVLASTIVAVAGDHGESLGEHGELTHAMFVYESVLRVPMMIRWPARLAPARVAALVRSVDLAPTLLDLAAMPALAGAEGQTLVPLVHGGRSPASAAYSETYFPLLFMNWAPLRSIQDDRWKFIDAPTPELYDLATDPHELSNLAADEPVRTGALRRALEGVSGPGRGAMATTRPERDALDKLAALGYIGATGTDTVPSPSDLRQDPKEMIGLFNRLRDANRAVATGRSEAAEAMARDVLKRDPGNAFATLIVARAQMQQGRCRDAIDGYQRYAALVPTSADGHYWTAICAVRLEQRDRAMREVSAALTIDPLDVDARLLRAGLMTEAARFAEAASDFQSAIELQPFNAGAHAGLGALFAARGEAGRAAAEFEQALELRPDLHDVRLALGGALEQLGRREAARAEYQRLSDSSSVPPGVRQTASQRLLRLRE